MTSFIIRCIAGSFMYLLGAFLAPLLLIPLLLRALLSGSITRLWKKDKFKTMPTISNINPKYQHQYVQTKSKLKFHYVHTGEYGKPLMLCLHGFPECWYSWRHVLDEFSDNFYVVAVDLRGYGDSDKPEGITSYHMKYLMNDVDELVTALGYEKCVLVGHDWGGAIAWETAHHFPNIIDKLIILNAPSKKGHSKYLALHPWQSITKFWYILLFQLPYLGEFFMSNSNYKALHLMFNGKRGGIKNQANHLSLEELNLYKYAVGQHITYPINYYRALNPFYSDLNQKYKVELIKQPTLIIWGNKDNILDVEMVPYLMKEETEDAEMAIIDGASHWVAQDNPAGVCQAMKNFFVKHK